MIEKNKTWFFLKYGLQIKRRTIWMVLILFVSLLLLFFSFFTGSSKKTIIPDSSKLETGSNMPPRLKTK
ncbi:MAG: hypothetical protein ACD_8C00013G0007 [uncultured bacterium]|nr:MAG: hypothetical protein ACD_8C00013G0007 [uncultured bacterium]